MGFLGPSGTFTEEAASKLRGVLVAFDSIVGVLEAVDKGEVDLGVVPIENSIEGPVGMTLDLMVHDYDLKIRNEITIPISHKLLVNPDVKVEDVDIVYSHIQALSQCRKFLDKLGVVTHATPSTSAAAELVSGKKNAAAIGTARAAQIYGLKIAEDDVQDYKNNVTRFVVIDHGDHSMTGRDKTSVVFSLMKDKPGGLCEILGEFSRKDINLTKVESRPSKEKLGRYIFFIDFEGHRADPEIGNILNIIKSKVEYIKILGSYPTEGEDLHSFR
ncbi:prephenate dehydratase [Methanobacterium paludis]|uniref:prephenate dehydratase n=1 Tax=Methanobacterium paludis (strain DSM 25820 / JCM 18151 / SWAN1) TaxID=868131 RepID=F6D3G1_METPW|nr:prephenate dehydratase [Methanobacterium paludis]AEG19137.1 Prephenate dehydratase [Methanobacterium paludis]